ncbi:HD domain-containing phosphohydrolase [Gallionella capsiferriformans]|uniref:Metal dependent phosphohydrolase n=1 Tax=Gallionella capsiferriformans (strain ES-2) TaxID=395494 RepID=D9SI74_GALCS|nr:HD domain-containing phosphohydrolase [Gallionella capsiferriformans]ADL54131.1 metal dependent phosphohydrolase [Gallionella capsiferriformans ES-2]
MQEFEHQLQLSDLDTHHTLSKKISYIHDIVCQNYPHIDRLAIAKYDRHDDILRTYVGSRKGNNPLTLYEAKLSEVPSLLKLARNRETRIINDLRVFPDSKSTHSRRILDRGFRSSYTIPLYNDGQFIGMLFFNSNQCDAFNESNLTYLDMIAHLLTSLLATELNQFITLYGAMKTATQFTHHRDPETGMHLERMARYSRLIAFTLGAAHSIDDEFVERILRHAPLHDVGKISIPDRILLKPGPLTIEEFSEMKTHTTKGRKIIDAMLLNFNIKCVNDIEMIRNIVAYHHESMDGNGYPEGLAGKNIPLEARIVAVADVFDALTSVRPYKAAWSNAQAFAELERMSHFKLDPDCVAALLGCQGEILKIQSDFAD